MSRPTLTVILGVAILSVVAAVLTGCGGNSSNQVFQNVSERVSWGTNARLSFGSFGGDQILYVYTVDEGGGGLTLLTPSSTTLLQQQGGREPAFNPAATTLAIVARRNGASEGIYTIDAVHGETLGVATSITRVTPDTADGSDFQPTWVPAGANAGQIVYTTLRGTNGFGQIMMITSAGGGVPTPVVTIAGKTATWAAVSPDGTKIAYTLYDGAWSSVTPAHTTIFVKTIGTDPTDPGTELTPGRTDRNEAPSFQPDGLRIAFHSNRSGGFDIWTVDLAGANPVHVTITPGGVGDGYPVYKPTADTTKWRIAFNRGGELFTVKVDGTLPLQLTRRF